MDEPSPDDAQARKRERDRRYRAKNRDKLLVRHRLYYEANSEKLRQQSRRNYAANRDRNLEYARQYRKDNIDQIHEQNHQRYEANRDKHREKNRKYYTVNRDRRMQEALSYYWTNHEQVLEKSRRYSEVNRDRIRMSTLRRTHADFDATWAAMWETQQGNCYLCGLPMDAAQAVMEHWHGCPGHESKKSCRYCQRGLAHGNCNGTVGLAGDDPDMLRIIADNLEAANARIQELQRAAPEHITLF